MNVFSVSFSLFSLLIKVERVPRTGHQRLCFAHYVLHYHSSVQNTTPDKNPFSTTPTHLSFIPSSESGKSNLTMRTPSRLLRALSRTSSTSLRHPLSAFQLRRSAAARLSSARWFDFSFPALSSACVAPQLRFYSTEDRQRPTAVVDTPQLYAETTVLTDVDADNNTDRRREEHSEDADDLQVQVYRPQVSPEEAERRVKTDLFLCLLLTLPKAQDWKDMLTAALRAGTWRAHHLDAVLRGVLLNKYNEPQSFLRSCGGGVSSPNSGGLREAALQASQTAPAASNASSRLHRARDILVFCAEEGVLYSAKDTSKDSDEVQAESPPSTAELDSRGADAAQKADGAARAGSFAPSPAAAHHLLAMLLQAAQRGLEYAAPPPSSHSTPTSPSPTDADTHALPTASYADVWHYLAWMELHGYHVLSHTVLDALEAAVDEGASSPRVQTHNSNASSVSSSASSNPLQYAVVSQRMHRLDYLRGERALLQEARRNPASMSGKQDGAPRRRQHDLPRTDPSL